MPSFAKEFIDFFFENGSLVKENLRVFLIFGVLCAAITITVEEALHKKRTAGLQGKIEQMRAEAEANRQTIDLLERENRSSQEEIKRLKAQFRDLTLAGHIAALREGPEGIAAEKISRRFQGGGQD